MSSIRSDSESRAEVRTSIGIPEDPYDEFMRLPVGLKSSDPRFDVRRAEEHELEQVFDCVDAAFGRRRPREAFDWLYRRNPYGRAQVWIVVERATGRILKTGANFPWPVWHGWEEIPGMVSGDAATLPEWQRKGLSAIRRTVRRSHPWHGKRCSISGPNDSSRAVAAKDGTAHKILGSLPGALLPLRVIQDPEGSTLPTSIASLSNQALSGVVSAWHLLTLKQDADYRIETIRRFESGHDALTLGTMQFPGYWCPHSWKFLNWRYLDHPVESYSALALWRADVMLGYAVVRLSGTRATLSEFAVPDQDRGTASALLSGVIGLTREAGCSGLAFFGTPSWRHWGLFRLAGMLPVRTNNYMEISYDVDPAGSLNPRNWQLMPGDRDYH